MTDEELKNKCTERAKIFQQAMESCKSSNPIDCIEWFADRITELEKMLAEQYPDLKKSLDWANERESEDVKRIAELEEKISVLLSCKNCPENKGGLICEKEYENKCLTQKIQYIKELEKENAELKEELQKWKDEWQEQVQKATDEGYARTLQTIQLTKAKEIIKKFSEFVNNEVEYDPEHPQEHTDLWNELCEEAEQFIKDSEVEK